MVESRESPNFSGGCFINLCDVASDVPPPKRKNALSDMRGHHELASDENEKSIRREKRGDSKGRSRHSRSGEEAGQQLRAVESREKQRRKKGVVIGVDPNVDAYLKRMKKLDEADCTESNETEEIISKVSKRN